ncbi:hypothetical protein DL96DRAFT_1813921 [Flagelloscypha sp. PMI_526]|nr:hypothetical protein DL96DRAFT_1813921 [Flagelloscypha sp. PMI_526]
MDDTYRRLGQELASRVVGPIPVPLLFNELLQVNVEQAIVERHSDFSDVLTKNKDPDSLHIIRNLVPKANLLLKDMELVDNQDKPSNGPQGDPYSAIRADANAYSTTQAFTPARSHSFLHSQSETTAGSSGNPFTPKPSNISNPPAQWTPQDSNPNTPKYINIDSENNDSSQTVDAPGKQGTMSGVDRGSRPTSSNVPEEVEFYLELNFSGYNVFDDHGTSFVPNTNIACGVLGKMGFMFANIMTKQNRTHLFSVYLTITGDARIIYWDRAVILVSAPFPYAVKNSLLGEFFYRFSRAQPAIRGHDISISQASRTEAEEASAHFLEFMENGIIYLDETPTIIPESIGNELDQYIAIEVPDDSATNKTRTRRVISRKLPFRVEDPMSRVTRGYIAYDTTEKRIGWLKDSWVKREGEAKEWDIIKNLNANGVPFVPTFVCGGHIANQQTLNDGFLSEWKYGAKDVRSYPALIHQRFFVREVGSFLRDSLEKEPKCHSRVVISRIAEAIHAHKKAFEVGYLHRDISEGNVLHVRIQTNEGLKDQALLIDWDMAKDMSNQEADLYERTGTWFFMSINMLASAPNDQGVLDDIESFFWLLVYLYLRYLPWKSGEFNSTKDSEKTLREVFQHFFWNWSIEQYTGGGSKKLLLAGEVEQLQTDREMGTVLRFKNNDPVTECFLHLVHELSKFRSAKRRLKFHDNPNDEISLTRMTFGDHKIFAGYLQAIFDSPDWPAVDEWADQCPNYHWANKSGIFSPPTVSFQMPKMRLYDSQDMSHSTFMSSSSSSRKRLLEDDQEGGLPSPKKHIITY